MFKNLCSFVKKLIYQRTELFIVIILFLMLFKILGLQPIIGMADNGDYFRVIQPMGLYHLSDNFSDKHFSYFNRLYGISQFPLESKADFFSTQKIMMGLALWLDKLFTRDYVFDIRFLSVLYAALFLLAVYWTVKYTKVLYKWQPWVVTAAILLILADVGYIAYFNSFYGEPLSYVIFLLLIGESFKIIGEDEPKISSLVIFALTALIFIGAKQQNSPLGVLLAILSIRFLKLRGDRYWKAVVTASCVVFMLVSIFMYRSISEDIRIINQYHAITLGILKDSPNPGKDLEELGIDRKFAILANTTCYDEYPLVIMDSKEMKNEFYAKYSFAKILLFYIKHPDRFIQKMEKAAEYAFSIRPHSLGNYEKVEGFLPGKQAEIFNLWSHFKEIYMSHSLRFIIVFYLIFMITTTIKYILARDHRIKMYLEVFWLVAVNGIIQFFIALIGAGEADLDKHLFLFNVCFDIMFVIVAVYVLNPLFNFGKR